MVFSISDNVVCMLIKEKEYVNDASRCLDSIMKYNSMLESYPFAVIILSALAIKNGDPETGEQKMKKVMNRLLDNAIAGVCELDRLCVEALGVHCCTYKLPENADRDEMKAAIDYFAIWKMKDVMALLQSTENNTSSPDGEK